jgi:hypothetical protein
MRSQPSHTLIDPIAEISYRRIDIPRNEQNTLDRIAVQNRREEKQFALTAPVVDYVAY